ncbi:ABC-type dipeptide/oligopeptide/nickel transport system, ATPase component [Acetitomaculum ruminis DSM 5522]|uniref:ABC-type dipeptide/oligopeptide/nickel transport system, ATPase component n=1 Tax=Acetitomaculum ruminis DSM 5522 TaxID=1120918 RepID=A0A1I0ZB17_9FIRM|nr:ABC transporter ATP-binding protein [Acetitomaculum ruminis]SFB22949.1 ABC-type dipeptide/oligopeptide/nickel transport system, ATPase component [Acetitomaculum ruminis DSM 5522]
MEEKNIILKINNCSISYGNGVDAVKNVSLSLREREIISIVGESGSGKTTLIRAIMGLLPENGRITGGEIIFDGKTLSKDNEEAFNSLRGKEMTMIFQDAGESIDPIRKIGYSFKEALKSSQKMKKSLIEKLIDKMLDGVRLPDKKRILSSYPFELSGGMKQRVGIAMATSVNPRLLLADEPTSALDVTIQAQIVKLLKQLGKEKNCAIIMVTHNMGIASYISDKIGVMKDGEMVEFGERDRVIYHPQSQYTKELLNSVIRFGDSR